MTGHDCVKNLEQIAASRVRPFGSQNSWTYYKCKRCDDIYCKDSVTRSLQLYSGSKTEAEIRRRVPNLDYIKANPKRL